MFTGVKVINYNIYIYTGVQSTQTVKPLPGDTGVAKITKAAKRNKRQTI